jgi:FkbM family methyltransferase
MLQNEIDQFIFCRDGIIWTAFGWDLNITRSLVEHGHFQGDQIKAVVSWMKSNGRLGSNEKTIVDVGANIGTSCIPFTRLTECSVLAIEPFPDNYTLLEQNIRQNGLTSRIRCIQTAVSDGSERVKMFRPERECGGEMIIRDAPIEDAEVIRDVPASGLMDILESAGIALEQIAFVWSDTEGSEASVVKTGTPLWLAGIPLYTEVYPKALEKQNSEEALLRLLPQFFDRFIGVSDLMESGVYARPEPISHFSGFLDDLKNREDLSDVLLLPSGFV